jgi:hypothetical protein
MQLGNTDDGTAIKRLQCSIVLSFEGEAVFLPVNITRVHTFGHEGQKERCVLLVDGSGLSRCLSQLLTTKNQLPVERKVSGSCRFFLVVNKG